MEREAKKVKIVLDGKEALVDEGLTILEAAEQNDIHIPTLCHHPALSAWGGCRICVVEVDGAPRLAASCVTPVRDGMQIVTNNERVMESRKTVLEFLFAERNHNCMFCAQSGNCELQDLAYELQMDHLTVSQSFHAYPVDVTHAYMAIDHNRCVLCGRCVRACRELAGQYVLNFHNRGPKSLIALDLNESREHSSCYGCGVCLQLCPTGAIYNRYRTHVAVKGHKKDWQARESVCPQCGLLCPTVSFVKDNNLVRIDGIIPGNGSGPDRGQLCYRGRFEALKHGEGDLQKAPMARADDGIWSHIPWDKALGLVAERLEGIRASHGGDTLFGLISPACSNETHWFFKTLMSEYLEAGFVDTLDGNHFRTVSRAWKETGEDPREASWKQIPEADFILLVGANPYGTQPMVASLVRRSRLEKGTPLGVLGRLDCMYPLTAHYVPVGEGKEALVIRALVEAAGIGANASGEGAQAGDLDLLQRAELDQPAREAFQALVRAYKDAAHPMILVGEDVTGLEDHHPLKGLLELALQKGSLHEDRPGLILLKPYGNSAGAWRLGAASEKAPTVQGRWKGGLLLTDGEPLTDAGLLDAMGHVDFLAVAGPRLPETLTDKAHVFLPKPGWMWEDGSYVSLDGTEIVYKNKVLCAPDGILGTWHILGSLAERIKAPAAFTGWDEIREQTQHALRPGGETAGSLGAV